MRVEHGDTGSDRRLLLLSEMKRFRVSKDDADIRGWDVVTSDKKRIGKVHELVVDTVAMKVRYLDIDVDGSILETKKNSHILVPIAGAQLDDDDNRVYLEQISLTEVTALPPFDHRPITREFESNIAGWFKRSTAPSGSAETDDFYEQEQFSDRNFWGRRRAGREDRPYIAEDEQSAAPTAAGDEDQAR